LPVGRERVAIGPVPKQLDHLGDHPVVVHDDRYGCLECSSDVSMMSLQGGQVEEVIWAGWHSLPATDEDLASGFDVPTQESRDLAPGMGEKIDRGQNPGQDVRRILVVDLGGDCLGQDPPDPSKLFRNIGPHQTPI
jgi:hypothetical protein